MLETLRVGPATCADCAAVRHGFCAGLGPEALHRISRVARRGQLAPGERRSLTGCGAPGMLILRRGRLKVSHVLKDGRQQIIDFLAPGEALVWQRDPAATEKTVEAMSMADTCELAIDTLLGLCDTTPEISRMIVAAALCEIERKNEQVVMLGRKRSEERVASFLLALAERAVADGFSSRRFPLHISRSEIGDFLGLTTETVSRTFSAFREARLIDLPTPQMVEIRDPGALREIAAGAGGLRNGG